MNTIYELDNTKADRLMLLRGVNAILETNSNTIIHKTSLILLTFYLRLYPNYKFGSLTLTTYTLVIIEHASAFRTFHSFNIVEPKFPSFAKLEFTFIVTIRALNHKYITHKTI